MHDLVITGGTVVDGTGAAMRRADVAIDDGIITAVGSDLGASRRVIDAEGLTVTPGWVDIHTHYDGQLTWDPVLAPSSTNGVTSVVVGNCGVGFAPAHADRHDWLIQLLEGVEDIPGTALTEGMTWGWTSFPEFLDVLDQRRWTVDVGTQVPHAALRTFVMGERGADHATRADADEIADMADLCEEGLRAGALGFTSSRTTAHRTSRGEQICTLTASTEEVLGISSALRKTGSGVMQLISDAYQSPDLDLVATETDLLGIIARQLGRPLSFTVQQNDETPDRYRSLLGSIARVECAGGTRSGAGGSTTHRRAYRNDCDGQSAELLHELPTIAQPIARREGRIRSQSRQPGASARRTCRGGPHRVSSSRPQRLQPDVSADRSTELRADPRVTASPGWPRPPVVIRVRSSSTCYSMTTVDVCCTSR